MKLRNWTVLLVATCLAGCGYRLGNQTPGDIRTVSVGKVDVSKVTGEPRMAQWTAEKTGEPRMAQWTAEKVRNAIGTDNALTLVGSDAADAHLNIRVAKVKSVSAGQAKLSSADPDQELYTTTIWRVEVTLEFRLVPKGSDPAKAPLKKVTGSAEYGDLIDITVMRQDAVRQALVNASRRLVRDMLDTW
jgi:hypothetical protein